MLLFLANKQLFFPLLLSFASV